jgi:flagella basal body P-ring formation protein FlgA
MKRTLLTVLCIVAVLSALCTHIPAVRADETQDYVDQIYQDQAQLDQYLGSIDETQQYVDQIYQDQQDRDEYLTSVSQNAQPQAPVAVPVAAPQALPFMFPARAVAQPLPMPPDARQVYAFQQMQLQQIMRMQQLQRMQIAATLGR